MKKHNRTLSSACLVTLAIITLLCSCASISGGDVTETGNARISGRIVDTLGFGVRNVRIQLLPVSYDPVRDGAPSSAFAAITDESGSFILHTPTSGIYNVEAHDPANGERALITSISVFGHDTIFAPTATIRRPGAIKALLSSPAAYIYLPGTTRYGRVAGSIASIDSVTPGSFEALCFVNQSDTTRNYSIKTNFTITSACTTFITADQAWGFSKNIYINTTSSGAAVSGAVMNFPLLIRLNSAKFPFGQAKSDGGDLRFIKSNGAQLSYEIERWDPAAQQAEIWVKVDTVYGNDSAHYFTMLWGDSSSTGSSNGAAVFDTSAGFAGVWHLGENTGSVPDATVNGNNGTATTTTTVSGAVGMAQSFDGTSGLIRTSGPNMDKLNFPDYGAYSVSAWVKTAAVDSFYHGIVYKSNFQYGLQLKPEKKWEFFSLIDKTRWEASQAPAEANSWHSITGVRSGTKQYLYLDGKLADSASVISQTTEARIYDQPLEIGHCPDGGADPNRYFNGAIDEVRISKVAYGADWIKLCYMNQKEQDALVEW